ncbi:MAG: lamin tail domain-containing protein [Acidimicrobiia bacterium]
MLAALVVLAGALLFGVLIDDDPPSVSNSDDALVLSVTDGDTVKVSRSSEAARSVRLIGINTPEIDECLGPESKKALEQLVDGKEVILVGDVADVDDNLRLLRYVYLPDGTFVNEVMVRDGFALANEFPPNVAESETLSTAQERAQREDLGLWAEDTCGEPSEETLVITHVEYDAPGNDNDNLNGEWVEIENRGGTAADLTGWVLKDESATHRFSFRSGIVLDVGTKVRVFTGCGIDIVAPSAAEIYWCENGAVWNNGGDTAFLLDPQGNIHDEWSY